MNKFEKQLEKWNYGVLRGAQAKLAKCLKVTTATVALWTTGKRHPSKGYISQMARLFDLDEHSVERLFAFANDIPATSTRLPGGWMLRETNNMAFLALRREEKMISLPVFSNFPATYPHFLSKETNGWWTIPAEWAGNARFLFQLPGKNDPKRLLFVEPCFTWKKGKIMLGKCTRTYQLFRVKQAGNKFVLYPEQGPCIPVGQVLPLGVVLRSLGKLKITP